MRHPRTSSRTSPCISSHTSSHTSPRTSSHTSSRTSSPGSWGCRARTLRRCPRSRSSPSSRRARALRSWGTPSCRAPARPNDPPLAHCLSSAPAPPQGAPGGSGRLDTPRGRGQAIGSPATASGARANQPPPVADTTALGHAGAYSSTSRAHRHCSRQARLAAPRTSGAMTLTRWSCPRVRAAAPPS